jgi:predicted  nucleic acid-binding Zn-ribbon protein
MALAGRLGIGSDVAKSTPETEMGSPSDDEDELEALRAERDALRRRIEALESELGAKSDGDHKFQRAKNAFARLYHPNNHASEGFERTVRQEVFKEFWAKLEEIDKGG